MPPGAFFSCRLRGSGIGVKMDGVAVELESGRFADVIPEESEGAKRPILGKVKRRGPLPLLCSDVDAD